jgi:hypothetical protein
MVLDIAAHPLAKYISSFPAGTKLTATQMAAQIQGGKVNRNLQLELRCLVLHKLIKLTGVATYEVL